MEMLNKEANGNIIGVKTNKSVSSIMSSLVGAFTGFLKSYFPNDYFKSEYIATSLMSMVLKEDLHKPKKMKFPALAIEPELLLAEGGLHPYPYYYSAYNWFHRNPRNHYTRVLSDESNKIFVSTTDDRLKVRFNMRILTKGKMQAMDLAMFLARNFEPEGKFYINNIGLKTEIPKIYIGVISDSLGLDLTKDEDRDFLNEYLGKHSMGNINRTIDLSDGNEMFEYHYAVNLLTEVTEKPSNSHSRKGKEEGVTTTEFAFEVEFWSPGDFFLEVLSEGHSTPVDEKYKGLVDDYREVYFDTLVYNLNIPNEYEGRKIILKEKFITDTEVDIDMLELEHVFEPYLKDLIATSIQNNINPSDLFSLKVFYGTEEMKSEDMEFNWLDLVLLLNKPFNNSVYHLCLYVDLSVLAKVNELIKDRINRQAKEHSLQGYTNNKI